MKTQRVRMTKNGDTNVGLLYYKCNNCNLEHCESDGYLELDDDFICLGCIKKLFFKAYDIYSIPLLDEAKGMLSYSSKAKGKRSKIPPLIRDKVFAKDKYSCKHCGCQDKKLLTVDHIHPYSKGGEDKLSNFQTLCRSCNSKKGART